MKYVMGLDIGIASIGWAVVNLDNNRIENLGVRLFSSAEKPKDGGAINEERRIARGLRRRLNRKRIRMNKIKGLFVKYGIVDCNEVKNLYIMDNDDIDTWQLRSEGLYRKLDGREWARVLTTIAKRRGYKSNRKIEDDADEGGKILKAIASNKLYMESKGYQTIGEMFFKDEKYSQHKRNKGGEYNNCVERSELENEAKILFEKQREFENQFVSKDFESEYLQVFKYQKSFMTPELMNKMIGKCTFEKDEPRAPKNSWTFERFMLLQKVNNLSYLTDGNKIYLTQNEKEKIIDLAYNMRQIKYARIRKILDLPDTARFSGLDYYYRPKKNKDGTYDARPSEEKILKNVEDKSVFVELKGYHEIKKYVEKSNLDWSDFSSNGQLLDNLSDVLTKNKTDIEIRNEFSKLDIPATLSEELLKVDFVKFGHLSYKAMKNILPFLESGLQYDKACENAGYNFKNDAAEPKYKLPVISKDDVRNPVVFRSITQTRKVMNAIIDKYGSPFEVHIEVARELTKNFEERKRIETKQKNNREANENLKNDIKEGFGINAKPVDMLKLRLYHEQDGKSAYSLKPIDYGRLFEAGYVEIDHAIPFSRSFDDSYNNKVLVLSNENQSKRNMTPYEYLGSSELWNVFESWVKNTYRTNIKKRENLLVKNYNEDKEKEWIARNLNDTKYISRYLLNYVKNNLKFENFDEPDNRIKVKSIVGAGTSALRHYWGISSKDREKNDLHHAEDAVIIACATDKFQNRIREYSRQNELYFPNKNGEYFDPETGEIVDVKYKTYEMERPWPEFKEELEARMSPNPSCYLKNGNFKNYNDVNVESVKPIFVSRMPNRKISGQAHEETIYSSRYQKRGINIVFVKKPLNRVSKSEIEMLISDEKCKDIYLSDKDLYDRIYGRLKEFDFKSEKAFGNEYVIRKYSVKGEGPVVRSIKVPSVMNKGVDVQKGVAANGSMARVDVFEKDGKNYLVPIYVADMVKDVIPNRAIKANKPESEWLEMDDTYNFKFSLFSNDLVRVKRKSQEIYGYYSSTHRSTGAINIIAHDNSESYDGIGVQNLDAFEKYEVDLLGNYYKVSNEKRKGGKK